ncbi:MAG: WG repeat-containing protein [Prevotellaceae bacterium]|jgi:hypothetical protein|nr:WG repeat-containing protein [Prevotellaceae bacterium]
MKKLLLLTSAIILFASITFAQNAKDYAIVKLNGKYGLIDKSGNEVISCKYDYVSLFRENLALVKLNRKWGFINKTDNEVIPLKYDKILYFGEEMQDDNRFIFESRINK